jgi:Protein tyrosine and serine/threonine kinase/Nuclease-related domain
MYSRNDHRLQRHVVFCPKADRTSIEDNDRGSEAEYRTVDFLVTNLRTEDAGDYRMLVNYNLPVGSGSREIDVVLINRFGVFLLEVKGWVGRVKALADCWLVDDIRKEKNVLEGIQGKARVFKGKFFRERSTLSYLQKVSVIGMVVLTQGLGRFQNASGRNVDAVTGLNNRLIDLVCSEKVLHYGNKSRKFSDADIQAVYEVIFGKHQAKRDEIVGNNYRILAPLSFGDLFSAYEAQNILIEDQHVRLKRYQLLTMAQPNRQFDVLQFSRNAAAFTAMGPHHNILSSTNFIADERPDIFYEVTELIDPAGGRLDEIMARTTDPIPLHEQLSYLKQLCHALDFAHSHNIYHRNICPETIFVTKENVVKLADFDFAKYGTHTINPRKQLRKALASQEQILIQKEYTAPELLNNASDASPASDIYALGVLWWKLAYVPAENKKFALEDAGALIDDLSLPASVKMLMKHMVAYEPKDRPHTALEVMRDIEAMEH